jgi:hypothetical protein
MRAWLFLAALSLAACAARAPQPVVPEQLLAESPWTVLVFFSADCRTLAVHEARLRAIADTYRPRGVHIVMIDSERGASQERDDAAAARRGYPFPIWVDRDASLARALGAEYAAYAVVVDTAGRVRYRGGIDSDRTHLTAGATMYLQDALDDLIAGREPRRSGEALGCALRTW